MSKEQKFKLIKYGVCGGVCLVIAVAYLISRDFLSLPQLDRIRYLCDAFFLPGILCVFSGALIWLSNEGTLDGVGYVLSYAFHALLPGTWNKRESYKEYLERKGEKRVTGYGFLFVVGGVFLAISFVFLAMFNMQ